MKSLHCLLKAWLKNSLEDFFENLTSVAYLLIFSAVK